MTQTSPSPSADAPRRIRSFVRRNGRMTSGQARALRELWPLYGIDFSPEPLDLDRIFGRNAPRTLEIGFGNGEALLAMATQRAERDFLGIEVHEPGVGHALLGVQAAHLTNVRVARHDAVEVLRHQIEDGALDEILIFFPDPWPKKRHHKRRLIQATFVEVLAQKLRPDGVLRVATDWQNYAEHILETLNCCTRLRNCAEQFAQRPAIRPLTRFERRGHRLGHAVWDFAFTAV
jgi:tRNA (guanine-N7-)-methyltransferase